MNKKQTGVIVAAAVAGLFLAGRAFTADEKKDAGEMRKPVEMIHCEGVNSCMGKGECRGDKHGCAGKNDCAGKGWVKLSKADCDAAKSKMKKS